MGLGFRGFWVWDLRLRVYGCFWDLGVYGFGIYEFRVDLWCLEFKVPKAKSPKPYSGRRISCSTPYLPDSVMSSAFGILSGARFSPSTKTPHPKRFEGHP